MAVLDSGFGAWSVRLQQASEALRPEVRWLAADVGGPLDLVTRMAGSDLWGGPFADRLMQALRALAGHVATWGQHLTRLHSALEQVGLEVESAARAEAAGVPTQYDVLSALMPWQRWPSPSPPLPSDWASGGTRPANFVWVYPERARQLAEGLRVTAEQLRGVHRRVAASIAPVGLEATFFLEPTASGLEAIGDEVQRRVTQLEQVDRELAGAFQGLAAKLGFPGSLAPPATFDPLDPIESSRAGLRPPPEAGPGPQPTQVKEADPVSTSTGNFFYQTLDLIQPSRGLATVMDRSYNSFRAQVDGPMGFGWSHSLGTRPVIDATAVTLMWGDGHEQRYGVAGSAFTPAPGVHDRLRRIEEGFELTTKARIVYRFAADGRLTAITDTGGNTNVLEYEDGNLVRVTDASGTVTTVEHEAAGRITGVRGVLNRHWAYRYSGSGDLVAVTDPQGAITTYEYDRGHRLISITDPEGRTVVRNTYDGDGRITVQQDGAGGLWRYGYEPHRSTVTDPLDHQRTFEFDDRFRTTAVTDALGGAMMLGWDEASNLVGVVDATGPPGGWHPSSTRTA